MASYRAVRVEGDEEPGFLDWEGRPTLFREPSEVADEESEAEPVPRRGAKDAAVELDEDEEETDDDDPEVEELAFD